MFEIKCNTLDPAVLKAFSNFFAELATKAPKATITMKASEYIAKIDAADKPDTGKEPHTHSGLTDAMLYGTDTRTAATVFGATDPNAPARSTAGADQIETAHADQQDTSTSQTESQTAAQVFGGADSTAAAQTPDITPVPLDSTGLPWDIRIHAGTRTQTAQGVWKAKKGLDAGLKASIEAELRQAMAAPRAPFQPLNAAPPPPPAAVSQTSTVAPPPPPAQQTQSAQSPSANDAQVTDFVSLCRYVSSNRIPAERIAAVSTRHGLPGLGLAASRPDLIPLLYADFKSGV